MGDWVDVTDPRLLSLLLFATLLIVYLATGNVDPATQSPDPVAAALPAWTWALHHTLYLDHSHTPNVWVYKPHNHFVSNRMPGIVFFSIPFYVLFGHTAFLTMFPATLAAAFASALAMAFLFAVLRRLVSQRLALLATLVVAFGTAVWSVAADALWPHGPDAMFLCAATYFLATNRHRLAAVAIGLCVPVRAHVAVLALVAGVWYAVRRRSIRPLLTFGVPAAAGLVALCAYNHWMFGTWSPAGGYPYISADVADLSGSGHGSLPLNVVGALFSTDRGLVIWCPLVLVLAFTARPAWRNAPDWARVSALAGLGYFLIQSKLNYFSGGDRFWSYRLTLEPLILTTPLLVLAAVELAHRRPAWRGIAVAAAIYGIGTQAVGAIFWTSTDLLRHSPWTYSHLANELQVGGAGPRVVMAITVALMATAIIGGLKPSRDTAQPPLSALDEPASSAR